MEIQTVPLQILLSECENDIQEYMAVYPDILRELAEAVRPNETAAWYSKCLNYNLPGSTKQMLGAFTAVIYKKLIKKDQLTAENLKLAHYLGWCVELLHSVIYVSDDVLDQSTTRRSQVCWYKLKEACFTTPTDVLMIENGIYELLRKHFRHLDCYVDLLDLFHKLTFRTFSGQILDSLLSKKCVSTFNMETYNSMVMDKTGSHALYLPAALALHLAGIRDPQTFQQFETILTEVACFGQVQNDFLDCYANSNITGRIGTDIQENKCSWLAVVCMQQANPEQRAIMVECYGQNDPQKIAHVKRVYDEMNIPSYYAAYKKETYNKCKARIEQTSNGMAKDIFLNLLDFTIDDTIFNKQ